MCILYIYIYICVNKHSVAYQDVNIEHGVLASVMWAKWSCSIHSHDTKRPHIDFSRGFSFLGYPFCDKHGDMILSKDGDTKALGMQNGVRCVFASSCTPLRNSLRTLE